jgi:hypothetical protein
MKHQNELIPAVEVKQNANPARHDVAIDVSPPASGRDNKRPMMFDLKSLASLAQFV